jgi:hypothetical protein
MMHIRVHAKQTGIGPCKARLGLQPSTASITAGGRDAENTFTNGGMDFADVCARERRFKRVVFACAVHRLVNGIGLTLSA